MLSSFRISTFALHSVRVNINLLFFYDKSFIFDSMPLSWSISDKRFPILSINSDEVLPIELLKYLNR